MAVTGLPASSEASSPQVCRVGRTGPAGPPCVRPRSQNQSGVRTSPLPHGGRPVRRRPLVRMAAPGPLALPSRVSGWGSGTQCSHCRTCWGPSAQAQSPGAGRQPSPLISWRNGGLPRGTGARGWVTEASDHLPRLKPHSWARAERGRGALSPGPHLPGAGGTGWQVKGQGPQTPALLGEA